MLGAVRLGPRRQNAAPVGDIQAGPLTENLHRCSCDPGEKGVKETPKPPWPGEIFSLDLGNLIEVRFCTG